MGFHRQSRMHQARLQGTKEKIPTLAENLAKYFIVSLPNSGVYVNSYGEIAICVHNFNSNTVVLAPDCENQGLMRYTCSTCNHSYSESIKKLGHDYGEWIEEVPATCVKEGTRGHYECSVCHKNFDAEYAEKLNLQAKTACAVLDVHVKLDNGMSRTGILAQRDHGAAAAPGRAEPFQRYLQSEHRHRDGFHGQCAVRPFEPCGGGAAGQGVVVAERKEKEAGKGRPAV